MKRILFFGLAAVIAVTGISVTSTAPVQAASNITICNSSSSFGRAFSDDDNYIYRVDGSASHTRIHEGKCVKFHNSSSLRIKFNYYSSYRLRTSTGKYGACHNANSDTKSNPGNASKYYYLGFAYADCTNSGSD